MQSKQRSHPGSPPPRKFKRVHSAGKGMASIIWDNQGVIMIDYLERGHKINGAYYAGKLRQLHQEITRKRRGKITKEARKTDSRCFALAGQRPCPHVTR